MSLRDLFNKKKMLLAVDFSNGYLSILKLKKEAENFSVDVAYIEPLSVGEDLGGRLKQIIQKYNLEDDKIITFILAEETFVKFFDISCLPLEEVKANLEMKLLNYLWSNSEKVRFDYQILKKSNFNQYKILCVSVKEKVLSNYLNSFKGFEVVTVDSGYFALQNCFELNYPEEISKQVALVDFYNGGAHILVCKNGITEFCSDLDFTENSSEISLKQIGVEKIAEVLKKQFKQINSTQEIIESVYLSGILSDESLLALKKLLDEDLSIHILDPLRFLPSEDIAKIQSLENFAKHIFIRCIGGAIRSISDDCNKDSFEGNML